MPSLPQALIEMLEDRIADPRRRQFGGEKTVHGHTSDPDAIRKFMSEGRQDDGTGGPDPFDLIRQQMANWGQSMPEMFLSTDANGNRSASSSNPDTPLARPASKADLAALEKRIGRPLPEDLRQMFGIADGGWGPGFSHTEGHGPGLNSVRGMISELDDLERRGPDYCGEGVWPMHFVPLTENFGPAAYDLDTGQVWQWDEHYYDHDKTVAEAWSVSHASLADFLSDWLMGE
ncbi:SMI1/KNR4 family protein [Aurantiacibacter luteus]|nr:SMI1/KNR4 family protein [Aurantiacibacter luteus]